MPERAPTFFDIPAGTPPSECRSCRQLVYWIRTALDRPMPVSVDVDGAYDPTATEAGQGISHFVDCPNRDQHRRPR